MTRVKGWMRGVLLAWLLTCAIAFAQAPNPETVRIAEVIELYTEGTYEGDGGKLRSVFHERAVMQGYLGDELITQSPAQFIEGMERLRMRDSGAEYWSSVVSVEVEGRVAAVTLAETGFPGGMSFTNYFHLIDDGTGWKIISKTFIGSVQP